MKHRWILALSTVAWFALLARPALAQEPPKSGAAIQTEPKDIVRLKNGGMVRGTIIEWVPGQSARIQLPNGETRSFPASEVQYAGPISSESRSSSATPTEAGQDGAKPLVTVHAKEARLHLETNQPGLTFHVQTGSAQGVAYGGGHAVQAFATSFSPICAAPCDATMATGTYTLALSHGTGTPVADSEQTTIPGDSQLYGEYKSYAAMRWAGLGVLGAGLSAGLIISFTGKEEKCVDSDCTYKTSEFNTGRMAGGLVVVGVSGIAGWLMMSKSDEVTIGVRPMQAGSAPNSGKTAARDVLPGGAEFFGIF